MELVTNREERVAPGAQLIAGERCLVVEAASPTGAPASRRRYVVSFAGVDDRAGADALRGAILRAEPLDDPEPLWVHELVGATVRTTGGEVAGRCTAVQANPASDLLVLDSGALVPLRFVVGRTAGELVVDVPPGLFEL